MHHLVRHILISVLFGAVLGGIAFLVDAPPKMLSLAGWMIFMVVFVVSGGIAGWYRRDKH